MSTLWFYWLVAGIVALAGVWLLWAGLWRDRSRGRLRCPKCWYRLDGTADLNTEDTSTFKAVACPECGRKCKRPRQLLKTRRRWFIATLGVLLLTLSWYGSMVRSRMIELKEPFEQAVVPTTAWILSLGRSEWPLDNEALLSTLNARTVYVLPQYDPNGEPLEPMTWWQRELMVTSLFKLASESDNDSHKQWAINWLGDLAVKSDRAIEKLYELAGQGKVTQRTRALAAACNAKERALIFRDLAMKHTAQFPQDSSGPMLLAAIGPVQFEDMPDQTLCDMAYELCKSHTFWGSFREPARDLYLLEMIRRRTPGIRQFLAERAVKPIPPFDRNVPNTSALSLELLTALRRVNDQPDPVHIEVSSDHLRGTPGQLPKITVNLQSVETLEYPIAYQRGGDNRGERPGRWRFHIVNANGKIATVRPVKFSFGGLSAYGELKPGDYGFFLTLDMNAYMDPLPPGRYTVTVQYHNGQFISDMQDVSHLIVLTSKPIPLVIE